jgi:hypothetical protein
MMNADTVRGFADEMEKLAQGGSISSIIMDPSVILPAAGALMAVGAQALANRAPKGGKSVQQKIFEKRELELGYEARERKREGKKPTFTDETNRITAKPLRELAALAAKHPFKAALPAAAIGAGLGASIARALK